MRCHFVPGVRLPELADPLNDQARGGERFGRGLERPELRVDSMVYPPLAGIGQ